MKMSFVFLLLLSLFLLAVVVYFVDIDIDNVLGGRDNGGSIWLHVAIENVIIFVVVVVVVAVGSSRSARRRGLEKLMLHLIGPLLLHKIRLSAVLDLGVAMGHEIIWFVLD